MTQQPKQATSKVGVLPHAELRNHPQLSISYDNGEAVLVKTTKSKMDMKKKEKWFDCEFIVNFIREASPKSLVFEYMDEGDLGFVLKNNLDYPLLEDWRTRAHIAYCIARALSHLHEMRVVHGRLDTSQILLNSEMKVKLCGVENATKFSPLSKMPYKTDIHAYREIVNKLFCESILNRFGDAAQLREILIEKHTSKEIVSSFHEQKMTFGIQHFGIYDKTKLVIIEYSPHILNRVNEASTIPGAIEKEERKILSPSSIPQLRREYIGPYDKFMVNTKYVDICCNSYANQPVIVMRLLGSSAKLYEVAPIAEYVDIRKRLEGSDFINPILGVIDGDGKDNKLRIIIKNNANISLFQYLKDCTTGAAYITWNEKIMIALDIARALSYLHRNNVVHMNLNTHNTLLTRSRNVILEAFGLDCANQTSLTTNKAVLCDGAPEIVRNRAGHSFASDVFSFGVILVELAGGSIHVKANELNDVLALTSSSCPKWFKELLGQCTLADPSMRPSIANVVSVLEKNLSNCGDVSQKVLTQMELNKSLLKLGRLNYAKSFFLFSATLASIEVNVKKPNPEATKSIDLKSLMLKELCISARVQSEYILNYYGIVDSKEKSPSVVIEKTNLGSLKELLLRIEDKSTFKEVNGLHVAICIAQALADFHAKNLVHGNLSPESVYLSSDSKVKLGDLYFTQNSGEYLDENAKKWVKCLAPEVAEGNELTFASDVFAFGKVLLALDSCELEQKMPYDLNWAWSKELVPLCCNYSPQKRPKMHEVVEKLKSFKDPHQSSDFTVIKLKQAFNVSEPLEHVPQIKPGELIKEEFIACGAFGCINKGNLNGISVAVKMFDESYKFNEEKVKAFVREVKALHECQECDNIVKLIGVCPQEQFYAMELMEVNLGKYLADWRNYPHLFNWADRANIALQVIQGIEYLHNKGFVHLDIKSFNILYSSLLPFIKLTDFGECRPISYFNDSNLYCLQDIGTPAWMAPELSRHPVVLNRELILKIDIYAFGAFLSELDTLETPNGDESLFLFTTLVSENKIKPRLSTDSPLQGLAQMCLAYEPHHRPTASAIKQILIKITESLRAKDEKL